MTPGAGAVCAVHPSEEATFTCRRCGAFGCLSCQAHRGAGLCLACELRLPWSGLGVLSASGLIRDSFVATYRSWRPLAGLAFANALASWALGQLGGWLEEGVAVQVVVAALRVAITAIAEGAAIAVLAASARDAPLGLEVAVVRGYERGLRLFACTLVFSLAVGLGLVAFVVPGVVLALGWCLAAPAVVVGGSGPLEGLTRSWILTAGSRGLLFLAFVVVFGAVALGAAAWLFCQVQLGVGLSEIPSDVVGALLGAPLVALPVVAWVRLSQAEAGRA